MTRMLKELKTKQNANDYFRRWFNDEIFDLFVWYDGDGGLVGFQLCYDKDRREGAITYVEGRGYTLEVVDSGEDSAWINATPVLREGGEFPRERVLGAFTSRSKEIDAEVRRYVIEKLGACSLGAKPDHLSSVPAVTSRPPDSGAGAAL